MKPFTTVFLAYLLYTHTSSTLTAPLSHLRYDPGPLRPLNGGLVASVQHFFGHPEPQLILVLGIPPTPMHLQLAAAPWQRWEIWVGVPPASTL